MTRQIMMTSALPYANGEIHLGHLVEYIQADVWSRFQKLRGHACYFVCADDAHGTPIMLRAEAEGQPPEVMIKGMQEAHCRDFAAFHIAFDNYHTTHSDENRRLSEEFFLALRDGGYIIERNVEQLYDTVKDMFLPDRYVRGDCPRCRAAEQYGDSCEVCGAVYDIMELKNPVSALSGKPPEKRESVHYFLRLSGEEKNLSAWLTEEVADRAGGESPRMQREAINKLQEWLQGGLQDWDISRDPPYFGFRIPGIATEKYFYVWLDAPIGYIASFLNFCKARQLPDHVFTDFWRLPEDGDDGAMTTEVYHFIGKDILYFHSLFWPTMLINSGYRRPTRLFVHGFLTVNGEKMSKSRGTFITAQKYLNSGLPADALRYYYACKLSDKIEDIDLSVSDFMARVNGDLVGKLFNIPSRLAGFMRRFFDGRLDANADAAAAAMPADIAEKVAQAYERRRYHEAVRLVMRQVDALNIYVNEQKPWLLAKDPAQHQTLREVCSYALRSFDLMVGYLSPVIPDLAAKVVQFLNREPYCWPYCGRLDAAPAIAPLPPEHRINPYSHLIKRMEDKHIESLLASDAAEETPPQSPEIGIDDFAKVDIRVAEVEQAEAVENSDKLLRLRLNVGDGRPRQVFAGLKAFYQAEALVGKRVLYLVNLKPRKMRFGVSEGMVLAVEGEGGVHIVEPAADAALGARLG